MYIYTIYMLNIYNIYKSKINYIYICKIKVVLKFVLKLFIYIYIYTWAIKNFKITLIFLVTTYNNYVKLGMCYFWRII